MRAAVLLLALAACAKTTAPRKLDPDAIRLTGDARMRTDTVGLGAFEQQASFVLVDAENTAGEGAYVTLGGELTDDHGTVQGPLRPQSLFIPAHEVRTFALVDAARQARPATTSANVVVRGAVIQTPPPVAVDEFHQFVDGDKVVVQAYVVNTAARLGQVTVIASFHDASGKPQTRPFNALWLQPNEKQAVQYVGPAGSVAGQIYIGDVMY